MIKWAFHTSISDPENYAVIGFADEVALEPDVTNMRECVIVSTRGNSEQKLELDEGAVYYFRFIFANRQTMDVSEGNYISFPVAVPLSERRKALLKKAVLLDLNPDERVRHEFRQFSSKRDALENELRVEIERLKSKGLPQHEEQEKIADLEDFAKALKDKFGI